MIQLAIISDDFTGALDTSVSFAKSGVSVNLSTTEQAMERGFHGASTILVVDAETRHLPAAEAYRVTHGLVARAVADGVPYIYIKTDSGLRGNIGSGLKAALEASGVGFLPFLPAFPDMKRVTMDGIHFVDCVPIHESVFGRDPYDPVRSPYVKDVFLGLDVAVEIIANTQTYQTDFTEPTIGIFDVESNADFRRIARHLKLQGQLRIMAGCAGFATILQEFIDLPVERIPTPAPVNPLLVVCGSLNPISRSQVDYAEMHGFARVELTPGQLLEEGYFLSAVGRQWLDKLEPLLSGGRPIVVDSGISHPQEIDRYLKQREIQKTEAREAIARALGAFMKQLLPRYADRRTMMIIGGDTLMGFVDQIEWIEIRPVCELDLGTVLTEIRQKDRTILVLTKSGGFGGEDLLVRLADRLAGQTKTEDASCPITG